MIRASAAASELLRCSLCFAALPLVDVAPVFCEEVLVLDFDFVDFDLAIWRMGESVRSLRLARAVRERNERGKTLAGSGKMSGGKNLKEVRGKSEFSFSVAELH